MKIYALILQLLFTLFATATFAQMQLSGISIAADNSEYDSEKSTLTLTGNVQIIYNGYYLSSDKAVLHRPSKQVVAESRVVLQTTTTYLEADKADFNLDTQLGLFYNAFIQSGKVIFEGDVISKVGDKKYEATNGSYTACNTCPPAWSFSGSKIKAELGGYADISFPVLKVADFPIFFLPKILVPLKSKRQSGVLAPSIKFGGSNGFTVINRYFWAISRSQDITLSAIKYDTRGWKSHGHYRYVLDKHSKGTLKGAYLYDQAFKNCVQDCGQVDADDTLEKKVDRGFLGYAHYFLLPRNVVQRTQLNWISDLRYLRDFPDELSGLHGQSAISNTFSITKNTNKQHISGEAAFYTNLLKEKPFASNEESVHRLPEIKYATMEQRLGDTNLLFRLNLDYTNFNRNNFSYDEICSENTNLATSFNCSDAFTTDPDNPPTRIDSVRDGQFDPGTDLIRTGQRLNIAPQFSYPILIGNLFNILPSVTFKETQYRFNSLSDAIPETAARRHVEADVSIKTLFSRLYGDVNSPSQSSYKHEIEPEILYSHRPWVRRPNHIFFGDFDSQPYSRSTEKLSDIDLIGGDDSLYGKNKIQFDYKDRLFNKKLLSLKLNNNFIRKTWVDGAPYYKSIAYFSIVQSYDFDELRNDSPNAWSNIDSLFQLKLDNFVVYSTATYYPYANATSSSTRFRIITENQSFFQTAYTQSFAIDENNDYKFKSRNETISGTAGFNFQYLTLQGTINYNNVSYEVQAWKYEALIKPPGECWNLQFTQWFPIGAEKPEWEVNFNFDFSGKG